MDRKPVLAIVLLAALSFPPPCLSATISWKLPSSYADGIPIDPEDVRRIVVHVYAGPAQTGPWSLAAASTPGATSVWVEDPGAEDPVWYTATATLDGRESRYAKPFRTSRRPGGTRRGRPVSPVAISTLKDGKASWDLPVSFADGAPVDPKDVRRIVVRVYAGRSRDGPWEWVATSFPGATSVMVMEPPFGRTFWYTARAVLDGSESGYSDPVRRTNLDLPIGPLMEKAKGKVFTPRKMGFLLFLILLIGAAWLIRAKRRRSGG